MIESKVLNIDQELVNHLWMKDSLEYLVREALSVDLLLSPVSRAAYIFAQNYYDRTNEAPTLSVLQTEFPNFEFEDPQSEITWLVERIKWRYRKNELDDLVIELAKRVSEPEEAMDLLRERAAQIDRKTMSEISVFKPGDHMFFIQRVQDKILQGHYKGVSMGMPEIDKFTGGIKKGNVAYYMARPKLGKTWGTLLAFVEQTYAREKPYFFTLENTLEEIQLRLSCLLSGVPWDNVHRGELMNNDWKKIEKAWESFSKDHDFRIEMPPLDERTVPSLFAKAEKVGATSIIISQFKYIDSLRQHNVEHEKYAEIAVDLKRAATRPSKELPVLVEAQFNRGGDSMADLWDFDGSKVGLTDMIPQSADTIYGLFRNAELQANGQTEIGILLARNHGRAAWYYRSEFNTCTEIQLVGGSRHNG